MPQVKWFETEDTAGKISECVVIKFDTELQKIALLELCKYDYPVKEGAGYRRLLHEKGSPRYCQPAYEVMSAIFNAYRGFDD